MSTLRKWLEGDSHSHELHHEKENLVKGGGKRASARDLDPDLDPDLDLDLVQLREYVQEYTQSCAVGMEEGREKGAVMERLQWLCTLLAISLDSLDPIDTIETEMTKTSPLTDISQHISAIRLPRRTPLVQTKLVERLKNEIDHSSSLSGCPFSITGSISEYETGGANGANGANRADTRDMNINVDPVDNESSRQLISNHIEQLSKIDYKSVFSVLPRHLQHLFVNAVQSQHFDRACEKRIALDAAACGSDGDMNTDLTNTTIDIIDNIDTISAVSAVGNIRIRVREGDLVLVDPHGQGIDSWAAASLDSLSLTANAAGVQPYTVPSFSSSSSSDHDSREEGGGVAYAKYVSAEDIANSTYNSSHIVLPLPGNCTLSPRTQGAFGVGGFIAEGGYSDRDRDQDQDQDQHQKHENENEESLIYPAEYPGT